MTESPFGPSGVYAHLPRVDTAGKKSQYSKALFAPCPSLTFNGLTTTGRSEVDLKRLPQSCRSSPRRTMNHWQGGRRQSVTTLTDYCGRLAAPHLESTIGSNRPEEMQVYCTWRCWRPLAARLRIRAFRRSMM